MLVYIFYLPDIYHCLVNVFVMVKKNLLILIFVFLISTRDLNKFMSEFDVLKFIVDVMEHMQFINTFNITKDVNVFVYTL